MIQIEESVITRSRRSPISLKSLQQALHIEEVHTHYTVHNMYKIIIYPITRGFTLFQCLNKFIFGNRGINAMLTFSSQIYTSIQKNITKSSLQIQLNILNSEISSNTPPSPQ